MMGCRGTRLPALIGAGEREGEGGEGGAGGADGFGEAMELLRENERRDAQKAHDLRAARLQAQQAKVGLAAEIRRAKADNSRRNGG